MPGTIGKFKPLIPGKLALVKSDDSSITGATVLTAGPDGLIDGIGNYDMLWKRGHYQRGGPKFRITTLPANYDLVVHGGAAGFESLTAPAILGRFALGRGEVILSQFRWEEGLASEEKNGRILSTLLNIFVTWITHLRSFRLQKFPVVGSVRIVTAEALALGWFMNKFEFFHLGLSCNMT